MKTVLVNYGNFSTEQCVDESLYNAIYNKALEDLLKGIKEILEDNAIYNIDCVDTLVNQLRK